MKLEERCKMSDSQMKGEPKNERTKLVDVVPLRQPYVIMIDPCDSCNFLCRFCPTNINKDISHNDL